ncbi:Protein arginine N-methyltransferase 6 [Trichinella pseudospiralis]|uniref:Protein arginine N-methyltransferase 6 n=1 Tax=Trichinella pseudospiralis TaxID=6337 RepID=A0A0V1EEN3_TRIPS|nr:Protein arginine N-methyltransferase 6 [Trichinella pseudospiralis]
MTSKETRKRRRICADDDESYFESYSDPQCHLHMILDTRRTKAYQEALQRNSNFISGKVDLAVISGILSLFACQAGAKLVHAVEASDIVNHMRRIISDNNVVDKVQVHNVPVEKLQLQGSVDCIVSEWMGYGLMTEWMLPSVIAARNRWLHKDGLMFPERVRMFIIPVGQTQFIISRAESWYDVMKLYGVDMDRMVHQEYENMIGKMVCHDITPEEVMGIQAKLFEIDLRTVQEEDLQSLKGKFSCECIGRGDVFGFCIWFNALFPAQVELDTAPFEAPTHWLQTVLYVKPFQVEQSDVIQGSIEFKRNAEENRCMCVDLQYSSNGHSEHSHSFTEFHFRRLMICRRKIYTSDYPSDVCDIIETACRCLQNIFNISVEDADLYPDKDLHDIYVDGLGKKASSSPTPIDKEKAEQLKTEGNQLMQQGEFRKALEKYNEAIKLFKNPTFFCNRAAAFSKLEGHQLAVQDCLKAIQMDSNYGKAYGRLGLAYSCMNRYTDAVNAYKKALELDPDNESFINNLNIAEERLRNPGSQGNSNPTMRGFFPELSTLVNNPEFFNVLSNIMEQPPMREFMSSIMGNSEGFTSSPTDMYDLLQASQRLASIIQQQHPSFADLLRREFDNRRPDTNGNQQSGGEKSDQDAKKDGKDGGKDGENNGDASKN